MTEYLKNYMKHIREKLEKCSDIDALNDIIGEHKDKISFMQHERLVHFLVTMMFAIILVLLIIGFLVLENLLLSLLVAMILILLGAYIKHYYFLENTVQEMYRLYDKMLEKRSSLNTGGNDEEKAVES